MKHFTFEIGVIISNDPNIYINQNLTAIDEIDTYMLLRPSFSVNGPRVVGLHIFSIMSLKRQSMLINYQV